MKRAIGLILVVAACVVGFLSIRGTLPFIPIFGTSMEPTLHSGNLLMVEPINPEDVEVGDIIVFTVPKAVRDYYNYPPTVSHRVIEVWTEPSLAFRTQGDNTGEDPFTVRAQDVRGTVGKQIPYLGMPLLFFQSEQGMIFTVIALVLLAIFMYGGELGRGGSFLHRGVFAPVIREERRASREIARKMESTEARMNATEDALQKFAGAVAEYAEHLASHTSAIQGLSDASQELKKGASEQNQVLAALLDNLNRLNTGQPAPSPSETDTVTPEAPQPKTADRNVPGCARRRPWEVTPPNAS
jgi:signal peptidase I